MPVPSPTRILLKSANRRLLGLRSRWRRHFGVLYPLGSGLLALLLAVLSRVEGLEATASIQTGRGIFALAMILLAGAGLGTYIFFAQRNWRQIVAYARTGRMPNREVSLPRFDGGP